VTSALSEKPLDDTRIESLGLSKSEVALARKLLGREPTWTEFGIFAVMWSEHCSYKSSKRLLRTLPTQGEFVLEGPGENAGIIALDDEWAIAFKIESHNHPSAIEPLQGAATGVGGILRDIFTMGARPIALLDSLHFGDPRSNAEASSTTRRLVRGVVKGIADYGNCVGVPTVGGETHFDPSYRGNPLVNVMAIGTVKRDRIIRARASSPGARVLYYGGPTGRDGIHGATFSSETFEEGAEDRRSAVQIGDPFMEKKILEATLELIEANACEAIQDMGAAGLTCSSCEMASRGGTGIRLDLEKVPRRAKGLTPYEIMLSESQERMLAVVLPEKWPIAKRILEKWGLQAVDVGEITDDGLLRVWGRETEADESIEHACMPAARLADEAPIYTLPGEKPADWEKRWALDVDAIPVPKDLGRTLLDLLASPEHASRQWIYEQYDHMVRTGTVYKTLGGDGCVVRIDGSKKAIAVATDSNARAASLDPRRGAMLSAHGLPR
jgi:phosphoribosylformylglycinamidine synthase subunit PurL